MTLQEFTKNNGVIVARNSAELKKLIDLANLLNFNTLFSYYGYPICIDGDANFMKCVDSIGTKCILIDNFLNNYEVVIKKTLIPFDVQKAKGGAKVVTRSGYGVRILCYDKKDIDNQNVFGLYNEDYTEMGASWNNEGKYWPNDESKLDLMIIEETINIIQKPKTELTISEIEEKLGIKNLKIVK